ITSLVEEKCPCGRTFKRISTISGRTDGRIVIDGISILPQHIEKILSYFEHTTKNYRLIIDRENNRDRIEIDVGVTSELFVDEMKKMEAIKSEIKLEILKNLKINAVIKLVEPKTIPYPWKPGKNIIDRRYSQKEWVKETGYTLRTDD
ncbi:MAG: hypothetical protein JW928_06355, partial [Candidatus Aureabacteria bacterium]|nr:hypothetical protein [Candidatus Auribacterota bacterium]